MNIQIVSMAYRKEHYGTTKSGDTIRRTTEIFRKDLHRKGIILDSSFSIQMPESYISLPGFELDALKKKHRR